MEELCRQVSRAVADGCTFLILSDRGVDATHAPIPALLATAGVHHHLIREGTRCKVGFVIETGEAREVHHMALLLGYGAGAINPYLAFETLDDMIRQGLLPGLDHKTAVKNYLKAIKKGVVKVMSKMGITTIQSYRGAQIFEAIGLGKAFVDRYFTRTASRIGGVGIDEIATETLARHRQRATRSGRWAGRARPGAASTSGGATASTTCSTPRRSSGSSTPPGAASTTSSRSTPGSSTSRTSGAHAARALRASATRPADPARGGRAGRGDRPALRHRRHVLRLDQPEAHETLAIAMNRMGGKSNTGEGGEDPARYRREPNGDSRRSAIKQVASGRFGVTSEYLVNADELQIKMAQGAKPGEGGQLPGHKVYPWIAKVRYSTPGRGADLPAAAPRHLLDRGPGPAHPRPQERATRARGSA